MKRQDINALKILIFWHAVLPVCTPGQPVDIDAVTGNMSNKQQAWFRERYDHYRKQAERARVIELR